MNVVNYSPASCRLEDKMFEVDRNRFLIHSSNSQPKNEKGALYKNIYQLVVKDDIQLL